MQMMQAMQEAKVAKDAAPMVKELNNVEQNKKLKELISNYKTTFNTDTGKMF